MRLPPIPGTSQRLRAHWKTQEGQRPCGSVCWHLALTAQLCTRACSPPRSNRFPASGRVLGLARPVSEPLAQELRHRGIVTRAGTWVIETSADYVGAVLEAICTLELPLALCRALYEEGPWCGHSAWSSVVLCAGQSRGCRRARLGCHAIMVADTLVQLFFLSEVESEHGVQAVEEPPDIR